MLIDQLWILEMPFEPDDQLSASFGLSLADEYYALDELTETAQKRTRATGQFPSNLVEHLENLKRVLALGEQLRAMQRAVTIHCDAFTRRRTDVIHRSSTLLEHYTPSTRTSKDRSPRAVKEF